MTATHTTDQPAAPATTPRTNLNKTQRGLVGAVASGAVVIAGIGFAGSYRAVTKLAAQKDFGAFAYAFPIGIDAGIGVLLALDLLLTWLRIPFAALRYCAWGLTAATIAFNAAAAWGDDLAVAMHATIPALFVIVVEAARHAIGRIANITAGHQNIESPPWQRWILDPIGTFIIWRRQRVWQIPSYLTVIEQLRDLRVFRAQLRKEYGRGWRRSAPADKLLVFKLARFGISVSEALARPETEAEAQRKAEAERAAEVRRNREAEAEALRVEETQRLREAEARRLAEAETEARLADLQRKQRLAEAEVEDELSTREQRRRAAEAEAELDQRRQAIELARQEVEVERQRLQDAEEAAQRVAEAEAEALRDARERVRLEAEALRNARAAARAETSKPKPETEAAVPTDPSSKAEAGTSNPKRPTELTGRRARIEAEVEALLGIMRTEGYDAVDLKRAMGELNLKQTTAYDRLLKAQSQWAA